MEDPRSRNEVFAKDDVKSFVEGYASASRTALDSIDPEVVTQARDAIEKCVNNYGTIYLAGNGGSAAICDHIVCDFLKGTYHPKHPPLQSVSMTENIALYTAIANDFGFEEVFEWQVNSRMREHDLLIAVSSSGNSENVIRAVDAANAKSLMTIGLSGFTGGRLKDVSKISIYVPVHNYGVVEDAHQGILQMIAQIIANNRDGRASIDAA